MKETTRETFAIVLSENMKELDTWFDKVRSPIELQSRPDTSRFRAGRALIISQDSHNRVFAVVGYLNRTSLDGRMLYFYDVQRLVIPVVLRNADGRSSRLVQGKGYVNQFMYLAPEAEERVIKESEDLCLRHPID